MSSRHIKRCLVSSVIREMHIKTSMSYYFIPTRMTKIKKTGVSKGVEKLEPLSVACAIVKWCSHFTKQVSSS